jgi:hypothetical protein
MVLAFLLGTHDVKSSEAVEKYSEGFINFVHFFQESSALLYTLK